MGHLFGVPVVTGRIAVMIARQASRTGRWALEKIRKSDGPPAGKDAPTTEGPNSNDVGGAAAEAATTALSTSRSSTADNPKTTTLPANEAQIRHIFRVSPKGGHLSDTPQNRQLLVDIANDQAALLGTDKHGNIWYGRKMPDGTQVWALVIINTMINGGFNQTEKTFHSQTSLSAPFFPNITKLP